MTERSEPSRRDVLTGAAIAVAAGAVGAAATAFAVGRDSPAEAPAHVAVHGARQAGIDRPAVPPAHCLVTVLTLTHPGAEPSWLPSLGHAIAGFADDPDPGSFPDGTADLTVTVGLGPDVVARLAPGESGSERLPAFAGDAELDDAAKRGDVLVLATCTDPLVLTNAIDRLLPLVPGVVSWRRAGFRGPGEGGIVRTPLAFHDGIQIPRTEAELRENVVIGEGPFAGGSIFVLRQLRLDVEAFGTLPVAERERAVGRRLADGSPLSGGSPMDEVSLGAKTVDGEYVVPADAHARRAHPSFTGSALMLRRSYSYDHGGDGAVHDTGLLFMSFQRDLRTFVATQQRLDDGDRMLSFATPLATFTFLILPGYAPDAPLGAALV